MKAHLRLLHGPVFFGPKAFPHPQRRAAGLEDSNKVPNGRFLRQMIWTNSYYEFIIYSLRFDKKRRRKSPHFVEGVLKTPQLIPQSLRLPRLKQFSFSTADLLDSPYTKDGQAPDF
jgi:hypothetical protein